MLYVRNGVPEQFQCSLSRDVSDYFSLVESQ